MFDRDQTGTINYEEFKQLWKYVTDWLNWSVPLSYCLSSSHNANIPVATVSGVSTGTTPVTSICRN